MTADILVDSSVWIDYFRSGHPEDLDTLIQEDLICTNEIILTGLIPSLQKMGKTEVIEGLKAIPVIPLDIDWLIIRKYQVLNLKNGVNKVGIPDLIILQQVIDHKLTLYSHDKHFLQMQKHVHFAMLK